MGLHGRRQDAILKVKTHFGHGAAGECQPGGGAGLGSQVLREGEQPGRVTGSWCAPGFLRAGTVEVTVRRQHPRL